MDLVYIDLLRNDQPKPARIKILPCSNKIIIYDDP